MERLGAGDLHGALELVRTVSEATDADQFLDVTLDGLMRLVPAEVATIDEVVPAAGRVVAWSRPTSFEIPEDIAREFARLARGHPLISHVASTGDGSAHRISDFWSTARFHRSELYDRVYRPLGVEYQVALGFPVPLPTVFGLAMCRAATDFSDRDVLVLNVLRPHLVQVWRSVRDHLHLRALVDAARHAVDDTGTGVVVLSDPPEELTPGVLVTMYRYFGRPSSTSPFPGRVDRWLAEMREGPPGGPLALARPLTARLEGTRSVLRYLPPRDRHPGAVLVSAQRSTPDSSVLTALGLTPREAEIVALVASGATNRDVAGGLGIAVGTVKKHLENVYLKLGVTGRGPLTAFVFETLGTVPPRATVDTA